MLRDDLPRPGAWRGFVALAAVLHGCSSASPVAWQRPQLVADPPEIRLRVSGEPDQVLVRTDAPSLTDEDRTTVRMALSRRPPPEVVLDRSTPYGWVVVLAPRAARGHLALPDELPWSSEIHVISERQLSGVRPWMLLEVSEQGERAWVEEIEGRARCIDRGPYGRLEVTDLPPVGAGHPAVYAEPHVPWWTVAAMLSRIRSRLAYEGLVALRVREPVDPASCARGAANRERVRATLAGLPIHPPPLGCDAWSSDDPPAWARYVGSVSRTREFARSRSGQPPEVWHRWLEEGWDLDPPEDPILLHWATYQRPVPAHEPLWSRDGGFEEGVVSVVDPLDGRACTVRYSTDQVAPEAKDLAVRARMALDKAITAARTGPDPGR